MAIDRDYRNMYEDVFRKLLSSGDVGQYDESALPSYTHANRLMSWLFWRRIDVALGFAKQIEGKKVLDFGCGGCVTFGYLARHGCFISGCDQQLHLGKSVATELGIVADWYSNIQAVNEKYDFIFALDVLEHMVDSKQVITKLRRLLSCNGRVIVSGPTENFLYRLGRWAAGFSGHYHVKNIYGVEQEFLENGFVRERVATLTPFAPLFRVSVWGLSSSQDLCK